MQDKVSKIVIGVICILVGIGICFWGYNIIKNAKASLSWPTTEGKIIKSDVKSEWITTGTGSSRRRQISYFADISYEYSVEGQKYISKKVSHGQYGSSNSDRAQQIADRYPEGKIIQVYYNPDQPNKAVLEVGTIWTSYGPIGIGALFILIGWGIFSAGIKGKK